ncbi:MAG: DinB family protein [Saprospiraceae bacterium]|nr:DinB family protein [Saprospiraceae bacterium]
MAVKTTQTYRNNGAIGALLDEYERALRDMKTVIETVTPTELTTIADTVTKDPDCLSIQTVLAHVVRSGYGYAIYIRNHAGERLPFCETHLLDSSEAYNQAIDAMFAYNVQVFDDYPNMDIEELDDSKKIVTRWGQRFDAEQLLEHAIVHILRHRRQIERFLVKLRP